MSRALETALGANLYLAEGLWMNELPAFHGVQFRRDREPQLPELVNRWRLAEQVMLAMPEHEKEKHFDMGVWGEQTPCGTVACLAGHCSMDSRFHELGFKSELKMHCKDCSEVKLVFTGEKPEDFFGRCGYNTILTTNQLRRGLPVEQWAATLSRVREYIAFLEHLPLKEGM